MYSKLSQLEGEGDGASKADANKTLGGKEDVLKSKFDSSNSSSHGNSSESHGELTVDENSPTSEKLAVLVSQAIPVVLSFFLGIGGNFINLIFAGHFAMKGDSSTVFAGQRILQFPCLTA